MKHIINVVSENQWLKDYNGKEGMNKFISDCLCDGCEVIRGGEDTTGTYDKDNVIGVHLFFYPAWLDFWRNDIPNLERHFGAREVWERYYQAKNREEFLLPYRADMEYAEAIGAEYVVFHVNDVSNEEVISYKWEHSDEEVIRAVAEIVNELTRGKNYHFKLRFEFLFTPGMMLLKPAETALMLELTDYENKGILMDTGHLMCAPQNIYTEDQGIDFVLDTVRNHGELAKYFKALHLHKSITGEYIQRHKTLDITPKEEFYERWAQGYDIILNIDKHQPFENPRVQEILELVEPEYVTHEISAKTKEEKLEKVLIQMKALGRI